MTDNQQPTILVLHGSRQTGQLFLGRMDKLRKRLQKLHGLQLVAVDAPFPHPDDPHMRQWWSRRENITDPATTTKDTDEANVYEGLETTVEQLRAVWGSKEEKSKKHNFVGMLGFSQGARLAHLLLLCHEIDPEQFLPGIQFAILVAGYAAPVPPNLAGILRSCGSGGDLAQPHHFTNIRISVPTLHVYGLTDQIIPPQRSRAVTDDYTSPHQIHEHQGGHHMPMKAASVQTYVDFIVQARIGPHHHQSAPPNHNTDTEELKTTNPKQNQLYMIPDEETAEMQRDEVEALQAIFPDEFTLLSNSSITATQGGGVLLLEHPIRYRILLLPSPDRQDSDNSSSWWPLHPVSMEFQYPHNYPQEAIPSITLSHQNNVMEFSSAQSDACLRAIQEACLAEQGMPCVLSCVYAARDFFELGAARMELETAPMAMEKDTEPQPDAEGQSSELLVCTAPAAVGSCSEERIQECIEEGLQIAEKVLTRRAASETNKKSGKGGLYRFTIGLVGKPSAGKSTFFNVATAFARQRGDDESALGGATMAPHPFTTIDPNIGYCLAPAPPGSCPEEGYEGNLTIGSTHGRDSSGCRLLPVLLKDVAGLVPGAYQGRGRGNKFLNDLTDANVLIHVLDASGMADEGGNTMGTEMDGLPCAGASHPLSDLAWIRKELIEWVYTNIMQKWEIIRRKGRSKLSDMFGGYGQTQDVTASVLLETERFVQTVKNRERIFDDLESWDDGDVHRLVSAFLGVRFPMLLALNKMDLPSSANHIRDIQDALPAHGAHVGIPLSANVEMEFVRRNIEGSLDSKFGGDLKPIQPPVGVWQCLQAAISLGNPVLVFPVSDFSTLAPLPGLSKQATGDPSLPSLGMIACLNAAGGSVPSLWDPQTKVYTYSPNSSTKTPPALRDALLMKPNSTVEDVFLTLKRLGSFGGEFVRAEGMANINQASKPVSKHQTLSSDIRILKIMTTKRSVWQKQ